MAAKKKKATRAFERSYELRLRLPPDLAFEIGKEAELSGVPMNRVIVEALVRERHLGDVKTMDNLIGDVTVLLSRYGRRIKGIDLAEDLLRAVDDALAAEPADVPAKLDALRVIRRAMQEMELEDRQRAAFVKAGVEKNKPKG